MRYYIYSRCSTEEQSKKGYSHDYQIKGIQSSPKVQLGECLGIFSDTMTGTSFDRPELETLYKICDIQRGHIDSIFVYRWDRFGRNVEEGCLWIRKFKELGVEVNCLDSNIDFDDSNWPVMLAITFGIAQSESLKISDRTKDGLYQANLNGYFTGNAPIGYVRVHSDQKSRNGKRKTILCPHPTDGVLVNKVLNEFIEGKNKSELYKEYKDQFSKVSRSNFFRIFNNPIYSGVIELKAYKHYPPTVVKGKHEAIISRKKWMQIQKINERQAGSNKGMIYNTSIENDLYLKGLLKDESLSTNYVSYYSKGKNKSRKYGYYELKGVRGTILNARKCHAAIDQVIKEIELELNEEHVAEAKLRFMEKISEKKDELKLLKTELKGINKNLSKLDKDYANRSIPVKTYMKISSLLDEDARILERKIIVNEKLIHQREMRLNQFINKLTSINHFYSNAPLAIKGRIVSAIFPNGFNIERNTYKVRTPIINEVILEMSANKGVLEEIKNGNSSKIREIPIMGG